MKNIEILEHAPMKKLLISLCIPSVIVTLVMIIYNVSDIFFISQSGDANQIAAVSVSGPYFSVLQGFATLLGCGGSIAISFALGKKDFLKVKRVNNFCYTGTILGGITMFGITTLFREQIALMFGASGEVIEPTIKYIQVLSIGAIPILFASVFANLIRADGSAKQAMIANIIGTLVNIVLNPIFISVLKMGITGAAITTVIGNYVTCIYLLHYMFKKQKDYAFHYAKFTLDFSTFREIVPLGIPMAISTFLTGFSNMLSNNLYGDYGTIILAANGVSSMIGMLLSMVAMGVCMGVQPAIAHSYGSSNFLRIKQIIRSTAIVSTTIGIVLSLLCFLFRESIIASFISDPDMIAYGQIMTLSSILVGPFYGIYQLSSTFLQSTKKVNYATLISLMPKALILVPTILLLNAIFGLYGLIFSSTIANLISTLIGLLLAFKWYQNIKTQCVPTLQTN